MSTNLFGIKPIDPWAGKPIREKKKRKAISFTEKAILWERNKNHICHICLRKIHSLAEAQVDHVRAFSKGGQRLSWAHSSCNRLKGDKSLSEVHRRLGIQKRKKKRTIRKKRKSYETWINPLTGRRERVSGWF